MIRSKLKVLMACMEAEQNRRITYDVIHEATGLSRSTLSALAIGRSGMVSFDTLDRLCEFFDCGVGDLLEYIPGDAPPPRPKKRTKKPDDDA